MDVIFKALNDPARRTLLDCLRDRDGQSLSELEQHLNMSRFGVMKHLKVLEEAHLVVPKKVGRFKYHYLNPLPLQEVIDRWINPFLKPQAKSLSFLKTQLEAQAMKPDLIMATVINCTHDALWDALTKGDLIAQYHFACDAVSGNYEAPGDQVQYLFPHGPVMLSNRVTAIVPKTRIEMDFIPTWGGDETPSRCVYVIEPQTTGMKLTVEHYDLPASQPNISDGWMRFLAGIKTFVETGATHRFAMETAQ